MTFFDDIRIKNKEAQEQATALFNPRACKICCQSWAVNFWSSKSGPVKLAKEK